MGCIFRNTIRIKVVDPSTELKLAWPDSGGERRYLSKLLAVLDGGHLSGST